MKTLMILLCIFSTSTALANAEKDQAIQEVQRMLTDKSARQQLITTPQAAQAAGYASQLTGGGANEEELYKLVGEVLGSFKNLSAEQSEALLKQAQKDPESFAKSLSPEVQKRIQQLADRVPAAAKKKP